MSSCCKWSGVQYHNAKKCFLKYIKLRSLLQLSALNIGFLRANGSFEIPKSTENIGQGGLGPVSNESMFPQTALDRGLQGFTKLSKTSFSM